jgi:hypothetical protein
MSPRITFKSCGSSSTLKRRNILPTLVILGSLQSLNTSRSAPPFVSQFAGEHLFAHASEDAFARDVEAFRRCMA